MFGSLSMRAPPHRLTEAPSRRREAESQGGAEQGRGPTDRRRTRGMRRRIRLQHGSGIRTGQERPGPNGPVTHPRPEPNSGRASRRQANRPAARRNARRHATATSAEHARTPSPRCVQAGASLPNRSWPASIPGLTPSSRGESGPSERSFTPGPAGGECDGGGRQVARAQRVCRKVPAGELQRAERDGNGSDENVPPAGRPNGGLCLKGSSLQSKTDDIETRFARTRERLRRVAAEEGTLAGAIAAIVAARMLEPALPRLIYNQPPSRSPTAGQSVSSQSGEFQPAVHRKRSGRQRPPATRTPSPAAESCGPANRNHADPAE